MCLVQLLRTDIIPIVKQSCLSYFRRYIYTNQTALVMRRRWNHFNQNAFLHTTIRTTALSEQPEEEKQSGLLPPSSCCSSSIMIISTGADNTSRCNWMSTSTLLPIVSQVNGFNFNDGMVHHVATSIMTENDNRQKGSRITVHKQKEMDNNMRECCRK